MSDAFRMELNGALPGGGLNTNLSSGGGGGATGNLYPLIHSLCIVGWYGMVLMPCPLMMPSLLLFYIQ